MAEAILREAAEAALTAPSIFNSQPWRWVVRPGRLELWADRDRQLHSIDPAGRLLTISCGVALHHALTFLRGTPKGLQYFPKPDRRDLLAVITLLAEESSPSGGEDLRAAMRLRRTDRRAFSPDPVPQETVSRLVQACAGQGANLHVVRWHQIPILALAAVRAGALQLSNPDYRAELADWTHRPPWSGDGVQLQGAVAAAPRRVPVRDFTPFGGASLPPGIDNDFGAVYGIVHTSADDPRAWLNAGRGLSAVLLTATAAGLGSAPISDVTEEPGVREMMRGMLPGGHPQLAVRIGHAPAGRPPWTPRRPPNEVIVTDGS